VGEGRPGCDGRMIGTAIEPLTPHAVEYNAS
jgi:hypothetical protein